VPETWVNQVRASLPELPEARKARFISAYGLGDYDADVLVRLIPGAADYFEAAVRAGAPAKAASNWIQGEVRRVLKEGAFRGASRDGTETIADVPVPPERLAGLIRLVETGVLSSTAAKEVLAKMWTSGQPADAIVDAEGLGQVGDEAALGAIVEDVLARHPDPVAQLRAGKMTAFGFLVGQVMKASGGKANPKVVNVLIRRALDL
jgi:aspartyl-tRNA(Asn)/glutamyl-tRNA(Gln) amidotransferase subunit B